MPSTTVARWKDMTSLRSLETTGFGGFGHFFWTAIQFGMTINLHQFDHQSDKFFGVLLLKESIL